jgi:hypothetical protein
MFMIGNFTISCITFSIPHNICKEAESARFTAKFPYITVLIVDLVGPAEASKAIEAPTEQL